MSVRMFIDAVIGVTEKQLGAMFDDVSVEGEATFHGVAFSVRLAHRGERYGYFKQIPECVTLRPDFYELAMRERFSREICTEVSRMIMEKAI